MYHLPIEITRIIYIFLGFFPCQGRLHKVQWYEEDKKESLFCDYQNFKFRLHVTKDKKYIFDRCNHVITLSGPEEWDIWELEMWNNAWRKSVILNPYIDFDFDEF